MQEASRLSRRAPMPVIDAGTDTFILSVPSNGIATELSGNNDASVKGAPNLREKGTLNLKGPLGQALKVKGSSSEGL